MDWDFGTLGSFPTVAAHGPHSHPTGATFWTGLGQRRNARSRVVAETRLSLVTNAIAGAADLRLYYGSGASQTRGMGVGPLGAS